MVAVGWVVMLLESNEVEARDAPKPPAKHGQAPQTISRVASAEVETPAVYPITTPG